MMRSWFFGIVTGILLTVGCASDPDKEFGKEMSRIAPAQPPAFLNSDFASLFGTANFSARAEVQRGAGRPPILGELSGRNGSLFFIADHEHGKHGAAGSGVLWDGPSRTAYLLNEPLQGYGPILNSPANNPIEAAVAGEEEIAGERCRRSVLNSSSGADAVPLMVVWRSISKQNLPIRVQTSNDNPITITLSRIRLEAPPAELFALPDGYKKYDNAEIMMSELLRRRTDAVTGRAKVRQDKYGQTRFEDDPPGGPPNRPN